jgi:hypothetical protein
MAWNVWLVDTTTGANRIKVLPQSNSWKRVINAGGSGQTVFNIRDLATAQVINWNSTRPLQKTIVVDWDKTVVYAGIIWGRTYNRRSGTLTVTHADPWKLMTKRHVLASNGDGFQQQTVTWSGLSLATLAKRVMQQCFDPASDRYKLPFTYAADVAGTQSRTYKGWEATTAADAMHDLMTTDGGPDIDIRPYWTLDHELRYDFRAGNLNTKTNELYVTGSGAGVFDLDFEDSADDLANIAFALGQGSEKDVKARVMFGGDTSYPVVESVLNLSGEASLAKLDAALYEHVTVFGQLATQMTFDIDADSTASGVGAATLMIGGKADLYYQGDIWVAPGRHGDRVIEFSGDLSPTIKVSTQPMRLDA